MIPYSIYFTHLQFRTFAPLAFRKFRNIFGIERDKFLVSLCAEPMIELSNPGASGSIFYVTQGKMMNDFDLFCNIFPLDDEIICKTVSHKESKFLQEILPAYYLNPLSDGGRHWMPPPSQNSSCALGSDFFDNFFWWQFLSIHILLYYFLSQAKSGLKKVLQVYF